LLASHGSSLADPERWPQLDQRAIRKERPREAYETLGRFADQRYPQLRPEQFDRMMHRGMQLCYHCVGVDSEARAVAARAPASRPSDGFFAIVCPLGVSEDAATFALERFRLLLVQTLATSPSFCAKRLLV
jgi:hypothetical protein